MNRALRIAGSHGRIAVASMMLLALGDGVARSAAWIHVELSPRQRSGHALAYDATRSRIVVFGGTQGAAETWEYDGTAWTRGPSAPAGLTARRGHAMAFDAARSRVVLFGGTDGATLYDDTWEYDGSGWTAGPTAPAGLTPRSNHAMAFHVGLGRTVLFGGDDGTLRRDTWEYDGTAWTPGPAAPAGLTVRADHAMAYDGGRARVVLFGGRDATTYYADTWEYDGAGWTAGPAAPAGLTPRWGASFATTGTSMVLFGGADATLPALSDTWLYDGSTWTAGPAAPIGLAPRRLGTMGYLASQGEVVLFGGSLGGGGDLNDTWHYASNTWSIGGGVPPGLRQRLHAALAYDSARDRVVMFAGGGPYARNDTTEFDGTGWTNGPSAPGGLTSRTYHAIAFDSSRNVTVLFGGSDGTYQNDTWEYDGVTWTLGPAAPGGLTGRFGHALAFDSARNVTVLFGGSDGAYQNDTWEYDGTAWTAGPSAPAGLVARAEHGMAFDSVRALVVLFGGSTGAALRNDTWEYDGTAWSAGPAAPVGLTARYGVAMAYHGGLGATVLFGGFDAVSRKKDTWEYDGAAWTAGAPAPPLLTARYGASAAYRSTTGDVAVFGGWDPVDTVNDLWLYRDCPAITVTPPTLPAGSVGVPYSQTLGANGGTAPYTFAVTAGALPPGLTLTTGGVLSGTPTTGGSFSFTVTATDANGCPGVRSYQFLICGNISLSPASLPNGLVGQAYSQTITGSGGTAPYTFAITAGTVPPGLTLATTGVLSGTPTTSGTYSFTATATDANGCAGGRPYTIQICNVIALSPAALPNGSAGQSYSQTITASGGVAPYAFAVTAGALPAGLVLSAGGVLSGTPTTASVSTFTVTATDAQSCTGSLAYVLTIDQRVDYLIGQGLGQPNDNRVRVFTQSGAATAVDFLAYNAGAWGTNVMGGDVSATVDDQILTGPGPGDTLGPQVRGFRRDGTSMGKINFYAYGTLKYGVNVGVEPVDADAFDEILSGPGPGAVFGPHVRGWNFDGATIGTIAKISYFAYGTLKYGVNVEGGDVDGDGYAEIVTGPGPGQVFGPQVRGWNFDGASIGSIAKINFNAFTPPQYGANVASASVDADAYAEIAVAPGPDRRRRSRRSSAASTTTTPRSPTSRASTSWDSPAPCTVAACRSET
ncbi:MAG: Ig domain-containing protein [Acidobacteriota bacterium]